MVLRYPHPDLRSYHLRLHCLDSGLNDCYAPVLAQGRFFISIPHITCLNHIPLQKHHPPLFKSFQHKFVSLIANTCLFTKKSCTLKRLVCSFHSRFISKASYVQIILSQRTLHEKNFESQALKSNTLFINTFFTHFSPKEALTNIEYSLTASLKP